MESSTGRRERGLLIAAEVFLSTALVFAALALGAVQLWSIAAAGGLVALAAGCAAAARPRRIPWTLFAALGTCAAVGLQAVPLPAPLHRALSPRAAELLDFSLGQAGLRTVSLDAAATARELVRLLSYAGALFTASRLAGDPATARRLGRLVAGIALLECAFVVAHKAMATSDVYGVFPTVQSTMVLGTIRNSNLLAAQLTLGIPPLLVFGLREPNVGRRAACFGAATAATAVLALTLSRSGMAGLAASLLLLSILFRRELAQARGFVLAVGGVVVAIAFGATLFDPARLAKFTVFAHPTRLLDDVKVRSWFDVPALIRDFWATGAGRGAFEEVFPLYKRIPERLTFTHVECAPLQQLADLGLFVGGAVIAAWLVGLVWAGRRARLSNREGTSLRLAAVCALVGVSLHDLGDFSLDVASSVGLAAAVLFGVALPSSHLAPTPGGQRRRGSTARRLVRLGGVVAAVAVAGLALVAAVRGDLQRDFAVIAAQVDGAAAGGAATPSLEPALRRAIARHPVEPWFPFMAGVDRLRHRDPVAALHYLNRALYLDPTAWKPHQAVAEALWQLGRRDQALVEFRLAYRVSGYDDEVPRAILSLAGASASAALLGLAEDDPRTLDALARALDRLGRDDESAALAERLLSVHPGDEQAHRVLAHVALRKSRFEEVLVHTGALPAGDAEALLERVRALDGLHRDVDADALLAARPGADAGPLPPAIAFLIAERDLARGRSDDALATLARVTSDGLEPDDLGRYYLLRSRAYERKQRVREAVREMLFATRVDASEKNRLALGALYERAGMLRDALLVYRELSRGSSAPSPEVKQALERVSRAVGGGVTVTGQGTPELPARVKAVLDSAGGGDSEGEGESTERREGSNTESGEGEE